MKTFNGLISIGIFPNSTGTIAAVRAQYTVGTTDDVSLNQIGAVQLNLSAADTAALTTLVTEAIAQAKVKEGISQ